MAFRTASDYAVIPVGTVHLLTDIERRASDTTVKTGCGETLLIRTPSRGLVHSGISAWHKDITCLPCRARNRGRPRCGVGTLDGPSPCHAPSCCELAFQALLVGGETPEPLCPSHMKIML